jgi:hypothetical protein
MSTLPQETICATTPALDEERLAWLALVLAPGLGPKRILDAVGKLEAPSQIFTMPLTALEGLKFPAEAAQFIFDGKARLAGGRGMGAGSGARGDGGHLRLPGVSGAAEGDLRSAAGAVGARAGLRC